MKTFRFFTSIFILFVFLAACVAPTLPPPKVSLTTHTPTPKPDPLIISTANARQVAELRRLGKGTVKKAVWTLDGKSIAVASSLGIYFYDVKTFQETRYIKTNVVITAIRFSPNGDVFATGSERQGIQIWNAKTFSLLSNFDEGYISDLAFSPDGKMIASGGGRYDVRIWDVNSGGLLLKIKTADWVHSLAFSPEGAILATTGEDDLHLWDSRSGKSILRLERRFGVAYSPKEQLFVLGTMLVDPTTGKTIRVFGDSQTSAYCLTFSPDGKTLAMGMYNNDNNIYIWDIKTGNLLQKLEKHSEQVTSVAFSPDGNSLVSASEDGTAKIWDIQTGKLLGVIDGHNDDIGFVTFGDDNRSIITHRYDDQAQIWNGDNGQLVKVVQAQFDFGQYLEYKLLYSLSVDPFRKVMFGQMLNRKIQSYKTNTGEVIRTFEGNTNGTVMNASNIAVSPDGQFLAGNGENNSAYLWDTGTGQILHKLEGHKEPVSYVAFSPDSKLIATSGNDSIVQIWETVNGDLLYSFTPTPPRGATRLAFSPDGRVLTAQDGSSVSILDVKNLNLIKRLKYNGGILHLTFSLDSKWLALWNINDNIPLQIIETQKGETIYSLQTSEKLKTNEAIFTTDGNFIASSHSDGIRIWNISNGSLLNFISIKDGVGILSFNGNSHLLAAGGYDGIVYLIDIDNGKILTPLKGHTTWIMWLGFSTDGHTLVSFSTDQTIRLWGVSP